MIMVCWISWHKHWKNSSPPEFVEILCWVHKLMWKSEKFSVSIGKIWSETQAKILRVWVCRLIVSWMSPTVARPTVSYSGFLWQIVSLLFPFCSLSTTLQDTYFWQYGSVRTVLRGVVTPCGGVDNQVLQLHVTQPEPLTSSTTSLPKLCVVYKCIEL